MSIIVAALLDMNTDILPKCMEQLKEEMRWWPV